MTGRQLRLLRRRLNLSAAELSRFLDVSMITIYRWEESDRPPRGSSSRILETLATAERADPKKTREAISLTPADPLAALVDVICIARPDLR